MERDALLTVLNRVTASSQSSLKILFSSREDVGRDIQRTFPGCIYQTMNCPEATSDISSYIKDVLADKVEKDELVVGDPGLIQEIQDSLLRGAAGMSVGPIRSSLLDIDIVRFLWVVFQLEDICGETSDANIRKVLGALPRGLPETYERALSRVVKRGNTQIARKVFRWVATARRPLSLEELARQSVSRSVSLTSSLRIL